MGWRRDGSAGQQEHCAMSKPLSMRTKLDFAILSPYRAAIFEKTAREYAFGPRVWRLQAIGGVVIAVLFFAGACAFTWVLAKPLYLDAYGIETTGTITDVSFRTDNDRQKTSWETISYAFTTREGSAIKAKIDRPVRELSGLPDHGSINIAYWERFPLINTPRGVRPDTGAVIILTPIFFILCVHFACLSRRITNWRRRLLAEQSGASATAQR
jgi:hypothetical protein